MRRLLRTLNEINWFAVAAFLLLIAAAVLGIIVLVTGSLHYLGLLIAAAVAAIVLSIFAVTE
ncbi:membrane protein [Microbacterium phage Pumpernickel]|uniref:Membrane protein n=1 Tax=Microbacterium phage Pumpernickel TaxID=2885983 RepID=A0AAE8Y7S6_9CAUD|nr:membrane protein [Microbacterium phage Pumpernickel]YP_010755330.1 membrane protein [Microbacterium phage Pumpernickel]UDL15830.1 membrane protein [Microbacterium phage Pumpernickel]UDL16090.1 membrane protein [Microbacterium phage Pumpernickel]